MARKDFKSGLDSLLESTVEKPTVKKVGRPRTTSEETRTTFILEENLLEKVRAVAWWERKPVKELVFDALTAHIDSKGKTAVNTAIREYRERRK